VRPETARIDLLFKKVEKPRQQAGRKAPYDHGHDQIAQKALARAPTLSGEQIIKISRFPAHLGNNRISLRYNPLVCQLFPVVMPCKFCAILAVLLLAASADAQSTASVRGSLAVSQQMVVVTASDWKATTGWLRRFERSAQGWEIDGPPLPVVLGRGGLGWGRGAHPLPQSGPQKKEGDGRSPAGIFSLPYAFGYAAPDSVREIKLPYVQCTASLECVDDTNSSYYNVIVDRRSVDAPDWKSSEKMRMTNGEYRLGIFVDHNTSPAQPGAGSCVFLHIWKGSDVPTSGCSAMSDGAMESLLGWLDAQAHPVLVQLPEAEYQRFQTAWQLPLLQFTNAPVAVNTNF
jgi:D-alanyl-D-alanine dipeptidase